MVASAFNRGTVGNANPWDYQIYMNLMTTIAENEGVSLHIEKDLGNMVLTSITSDKIPRCNHSMLTSLYNLVKEQALDYQFDTLLRVKTIFNQ